MSRANVMIVDDDRDLAESLAELLEMSGCSVTTAANGKEAVSGHGTQDFDVTFMDVAHAHHERRRQLFQTPQAEA
jgi:CheY-like chemotaxis protein